MIGWYVHHHGLGHLHRARAVCAALGAPVTGLSSLSRPDGWDGDWITLDRDDDGATRDPDAGGHLHWVPRLNDGLRSRMAAVSAWIAAARPDVVVCDVSVEVALLCRLHGVPVVCVAMPGDRSDAAHRLGYGIATELVACWPPQAMGMVEGVRTTDLARMHLVGAVSRFGVADSRPRRTGRRRVTVLLGGGGTAVTADLVDRASRETPDWQWTVLGAGLGRWDDDPSIALRDADVVVTHTGEGALAEVAAARRPAIVIPGSRPHDEQRTTARVLAAGTWPVVVRDHWPTAGWRDLLVEASRLDGAGWSSWCDGAAARRMADLIRETARRARREAS